MKNDKTQIYSDGDKTSIYGETKKRTKESGHQIKAGDQIQLNGADYKITGIISESTGEAVVYKAEDQRGKIIGLKIYFEFHEPENEPNAEALERVKTIDDPDILKLIDYGTGEYKYEGKYCYEIMQYAEGLDLLDVKDLKTKYSPDFLEKNVIPEIFKGILKLHENKIYHCDLKPQNVFFLDKEQQNIVVGDYGSAKTFDYDAEKSSRKTTIVKGTDFYLPPEQARGFISEKNDYYSFGMILLHLFYPHKILTDNGKTISQLKFKQIIERQFESKPIIDFDPKFKRLNNLIEGLTLADFNLRWGKEEVQKFIEGENLNVNYSRSGISKKEPDNLLIFGNYRMNTVYDIRDFILNDPDWYEDLIEDKQNRTDFTEWIIQLYNGNRSKRSEFNRIIKEYSQDGIEFVADALIRFFVPEHPVVFGLKTFDFFNSEDLQITIAQAFSHLLNNLWETSSEKELKLYLFRFEFALGRIEREKIEITKILRILYRELDVKFGNKKDFFDYSVNAYFKFTKESKNQIENFLLSYLPSERTVEFAEIDNKFLLSYNLKSHLSNFCQKIGIHEIDLERTESEKIDVNNLFSDQINENYNIHTAEIILKNICKKHQIELKDTTNENLNSFTNDLQKGTEILIEELELSYKDLQKKCRRKTKKEELIKSKFTEIENIIKKHEIQNLPKAFKAIKSIKTGLKQLKKGEKEKGFLETRLSVIIFVISIIVFVILFGLLISHLEGEAEKEKNAKDQEYDEMILEMENAIEQIEKPQ